MISEFDLLANKITELAELTQALRRDNAGVRTQNTELIAENRQLSEKTQEASQKITELAEVVQTLQHDSTGVHAQNTELITENRQLKERMAEASQRISLLLASLPVQVEHEENVK